MDKKISRRQFIEKSAKAGVTAAIGGAALSNMVDGSLNSVNAQDVIDISVVNGANFLENTKRAVDILGGMGKFVPRGSRVAILPNVQRAHPGTFTN